MAKKKKVTKSKKNKKAGLGGIILGIAAFMTAAMNMPTTILLIWGMIPTVVIAAFSRKKDRTRAITVGSLNLAGCTPFLLHLWSIGGTIEDSVIIATDPRFMIVVWGAAGLGYMVDWALSGIVATVLVERAKSRVEAIHKEQDELVERWGREVKGDMPLDAFGFPIDNAPAQRGRSSPKSENGKE